MLFLGGAGSDKDTILCALQGFPLFCSLYLLSGKSGQEKNSNLEALLSKNNSGF
jgi:hypothetical protein